MGEGLLIVLSGPSGSGKGSVLKKLMDRNSGIRLSVSATTRKPRRGEVEGRHYYFKTVDEFRKMIRKDELVEWVEYCGNYYGTPRDAISRFLREGSDVVLEIEVEGAMNLKSSYPGSVLIFILPPGFHELRRRILKRGTEKDTVLRRRLERAADEIQYAERYDYIVVNRDICRAVEDMEAILRAERLKAGRNIGFIREFEKMSDVEGCKDD